MNRLYDKLQAAMSESKVKNFLLSKATASKRSRLDAGEVILNTDFIYLIINDFLTVFYFIKSCRLRKVHSGTSSF